METAGSFLGGELVDERYCKLIVAVCSILDHPSLASQVSGGWGGRGCLDWRMAANCSNKNRAFDGTAGTITLVVADDGLDGGSRATGAVASAGVGGFPSSQTHPCLVWCQAQSGTKTLVPGFKVVPDDAGCTRGADDLCSAKFQVGRCLRVGQWDGTRHL